MVRGAERSRPCDSLETKEDHPGMMGAAGSDGEATEGNPEEWLKGEVRCLKTANNGTCLVAKRKYKLRGQNTGVIVRVRSLRRREVMELSSGLASGQGEGREASIDAGWQVSVE